MPNKSDFNHFEYNPVDIDISRSVFNLDHSVKWSCNLGELIPFDIIECNPGETFEIDTSKVIRTQPLVAPIMDEILCDTFYFFVPHRLVWNHWVNFCGENTATAWAPHTEYAVPVIISPEDGWYAGSIADYLGVPINQKVVVNALPFRSYALICDQWFRSEAVMNPVHVNVSDVQPNGVNTGDQVTDIELGGKPFIACKLADYFTTALPSPQRGDATKVFPYGSFAPVVTPNSNSDNYYPEHPYSVGHVPGDSVTVTHKSNIFLEDYSYPGYVAIATGKPPTGHSYLANADTPTTIGGPFWFSNLYAQLDGSTFNINDLRQAFAVQRYLEKSARFGGRYIEFIKGFFGIDSPDARLQRTEYLGGSRFVLNINQVTQNSASEEGLTPLGNVAGLSVSAENSSDVSYSTTEHGYIIGVCVFRHHPSYQQGLNKLWLRQSFTDFYLPTFAHLGEQAVSSQELFALDALSEDIFTFGYQERYSEYRMLPNRVAGELRSSYAQSLDMWHLGDYYATAPHLTPEWIREDKSVLDRCLAVTSDVSNQFICDFFVKVKATRPMPLYGIPGLIDHN